jgi:aminoacyl tRNA synthase complex-interacting multifunctional protein 2
MMVSPQSQTPVEGVANISRYLCREYYPALYDEEGRGGAESASLIDSWLDLVSTTFQRGSAKEKASILRKLNAQLGSAQFLVGDQLSVADIVGFCAVCEQPGLKPPGNVKSWLQRVQRSVPGLATVPCPYIVEDSS